MRAKSLIAFMKGYVDFDPCPLCEENSVINASTQIKLDIRGFGPLTVRDYQYCVCDNPECGFEFVGPEQSKHNDERILVEKILHRGTHETKGN